MDINQLDIELDTKAKETYKLILKKSDVKIFFELPNEEENINEITTIKENIHTFTLMKKSEMSQLININEKYYNIISDNIKNKLKKLTMKEKKKLLTWKTWYLIFLIPFFGKRFKVKEEIINSYRLNYNAVIINLTKLEYDRFLYYTRYVYKLQQIYKLNHELNIQQEFSIIFDDDKSAINLYQDMYNNFKGLIEPNDDSDIDIDDIDDDFEI